MNYNKIAIVGPRGSGKTTISDQLSRELSLPVFHMDEIVWDENWNEYPKDEYISKHSDLISKSEWLIEGYINNMMLDRLEKADLVVYLNYSRLICSIRLLRRYAMRTFNYYIRGVGIKPEESVVSLIKFVCFNFIKSDEMSYYNSLLSKYDSNKVVKIRYIDTAFKKYHRVLSKFRMRKKPLFSAI